jgi:hypothetical protein
MTAGILCNYSIDFIVWEGNSNTQLVLILPHVMKININLYCFDLILHMCRSLGKMWVAFQSTVTNVTDVWKRLYVYKWNYLASWWSDISCSIDSWIIWITHSYSCHPKKVLCENVKFTPENLSVFVLQGVISNLVWWIDIVSVLIHILYK